MRHVRILMGACLAVFALAAVAASTASASLPEFGGCEAAGKTEVRNGSGQVVSVAWKGKYENAECTNPNQPEGKALRGKEKKEKGQYEWYTGAQFGKVFREAKGDPPYELENVRYEGELGPATFETSTGKTIQCQGGTTFMYLDNPGPRNIGKPELEEHYTLHGSDKGVKEILLDFSGCESEGYECHSFLGTEGEITNESGLVFEDGEYLVGEIGFINEQRHEVGLSLTTIGKTTPNRPWLVINSAICGGPVGTVWLGGSRTGGNSFISVITPVDQMITEFTQTYSQGAPGEQIPAAFEGKHEDTLRAYLSNENLWEPMALSTTFTEHRHFRGQPPVEIKAEP